MDEFMRLLTAWPAGILGKPLAARTAGGIDVANDHVIKQNVMKSTRPELAADEVGMDIEHRHFAEGLFEVGLEGVNIHECSIMLVDLDYFVIGSRMTVTFVSNGGMNSLFTSYSNPSLGSPSMVLIGRSSNAVVKLARQMIRPSLAP